MFDKKAYMKKYNQEHYTEQKEWTKQHPENIHAKRERFKLLHPDYWKEKRKLYKPKIDVYNQDYYKENKEKIKAENSVRYEPLAGKCEICDSPENLVHHHPDYSEPWFYVTLCSSCHKYVHNDLVKP